jgi:hypothetical protein
MKDAQRPDHVSLGNLVNRLREGRYVIPDFQREFEWKPGDITALVRSIFLDYFIGSLLLWKGKKSNLEAFSCEAIYGFQGPQSPDTIVLDGQQRLTAMYYAFMAPDVRAPGRSSRYLFFVRVDKFMEEEYEDAFDYDWTRKGENILKDETLQFEQHRFPLAVIGRGDRAVVKWSDAYGKYWGDREATAKQAGNAQAEAEAHRHAANAEVFDQCLAEITQQFQVSYIELDEDLAPEKVCDIFTQINSRGIRLDVFDLINALLKPKHLALKQMWRDAAPKLAFVQTDRMNVYILQVMSILRQSYCSPKYLYYLLPGQEKKVREADGSLRREVLVSDGPQFVSAWSEAVEALQQAIAVLRHPQEFGVISSQYLPYISILPAFAAIRTAARSLPPANRLDAERKIRHWYWASVFTNRYSGSVESTAARDFVDVKAWFAGDEHEPALIREFQRGARELELRRETKRGSSIYNGIFNLLVLRGARDWMSGAAPQPGDLDDHHIIPKSWGVDHGLAGAIDTILNRTPLTEETNRKIIGTELPNQYLPRLIAASGENTVRAILESHLISPAGFDILLRNPFGPDDFEDFVTERQRTIIEAIEDLLVKERLDLSPHLRDLDTQVEKVELALRRIVNTGLGGDALKLPSHVQQKIENRIQAAAKRNPGFNLEYYQGLDGKLEYADLREIQDVLLGKAGWPLFQSRFVNPETLAKRFDQIAELRNGIRHSRSVDEVTRKEGEAALLWFQQVLGK